MEGGLVDINFLSLFPSDTKKENSYNSLKTNIHSVRLLPPQSLTFITEVTSLTKNSVQYCSTPYSTSY